MLALLQVSTESADDGREWLRALLQSCLDLSMLLQIMLNKKVLQAICLLFYKLKENASTFTFQVHLANCNLSAGVHIHVYLTHYNNSTKTEGSIKTIMLIILHQGAVTETFFICASQLSLVQLSALDCREKPLETHQITNMPVPLLTATMYHIKSEPR